ncbi:MAG: hypothetical protein M3O15_13340, partial [Acidobacteriota bacterium]|nr:hypothetical protein [Acidobacteriota bacterium]
MSSIRRSRKALGLLAVCLCCAIPCLAATAAGGEAAPPAGPAAVEAPNGKFALSGGIYLFEYLPQLTGAKEKFEIYAFILNVDAVTGDGRYGLHVQTRARDSKLRSFFLSNVWFQEAYAWAKTPVGDVHAGKFYRKVGILWDDSFFGNVQYFNGLKLNPDYGAELVGTRPLGGPLAVDYSVQYFTNNDHVAGSLPGRDVESDPNANLRRTVTARLVPTFKLGPGRTLAVGVSGLSGRIDRTVGPSFDLRQAAGDMTLTWGPTISYVELLRQRGERDDAAHPLSRPGYRDGTYLLAGARWQVLSWLNARLNYSQVDYQGQKAREVELVPGLVFGLRPNLNLIAEYDSWRTEPNQGGPSQYIDKSW